MTDPKEIYLQPWCADCERASVKSGSDVGRCWAEDDPWTKCDECDRPAVRYVLSPVNSYLREQHFND